jgi:hypothetical protein
MSTIPVYGLTFPTGPTQMVMYHGMNFKLLFEAIDLLYPYGEAAKKDE